MSLMLSTLPFLHFPTYLSPPCDLAESERARILENFRHATIKWNQYAVQATDEVENKEDPKSHMVVVTDVCLPLASGESPLSARVLINFELPVKKEIYARRMAACLAPDGIMINMVVGGEVVTLKSIEEACNLVIAEMPIQVSEIL